MACFHGEMSYQRPPAEWQDLTKLKHVILDEVDQMLAMGFPDQVEEILCVAYKKGKLHIQKLA